MGEPILFFPYNGAFYFVVNRPNPTHLPILAYAFTEEMQLRAVKELAESGTHWIIWDKDNNSLDGVPIEQHLSRIVAYIRTNYKLRETIGPFDFLSRD